MYACALSKNDAAARYILGDTTDNFMRKKSFAACKKSTAELIFTKCENDSASTKRARSGVAQ